MNCELNGLADMYLRIIQKILIPKWRSHLNQPNSTANTFLVRYIFIYFNFVIFFFFVVVVVFAMRFFGVLTEKLKVCFVLSTTFIVTWFMIHFI